MRRFRPGTALGLAFLLAASIVISGSAASAAPSGGPPTSPVDGEPRTTSDATALSALLVTPREPVVPFAGSDGHITATYELGVQNATPLTLTLTAAEVLDPAGKVLQHLDQAAVAANLALPSQRGGVQTLLEAQAATLYVTVQFARRSDVPRRLDNRITFTGLPTGAASSDVVGVPVSGLEPPVLGPPLEPGSRYIAADSCCDSPRHRMALLPIDNRQWLVQRFAVDWEQLDAQDRTVSRGDPADPAAYTIYGKKVVAASEGTVVHVIDNLPDQTPGGLPTGLSLAEVGRASCRERV